MKIVIRKQQGMEDHHFSGMVRRRIRLVLSRFATSIQSVRVGFSSLDGHENIDTRCIVNVKLSPIGEIIVQGDAEHAIPALNYCLARTERTIRRKLEKHRDSPVRLPRKREAKEEELPLSFSADKETKDKGQFNEKHHKNT